MQIGAPVGERQNSDRDLLAIEIGNGEADTFDGDRAFLDHPLANDFGDANLEGPVGGLAVEVGAGLGDDGVERGHHARAVDVALHDVAAERAARCGGQFQIDTRAGCKRAERGAIQRFLREVGVEIRGVGIERGEANAGHAERVAFAQARRDAGRFNRDAANAAAIGEADEISCLLDDAGEHESMIGS